MTRCEFLVNEVSSSCTSCTGWFCMAKGRKKKVGDTTICNNDELWSTCTRYLQVYPEQEPLPPPEPKPELEIEEISSTETFDEYTLPVDEVLEDEITDIPEPPKPRIPRILCPYVGAPPPGVKTCCGLYCYAVNEPVRTGTQCKSRPSWLECVKRVQAVNRGVPYAVG